MTRQCGLIVAIDTSSYRDTAAVVAAVRPYCGMIKLGLEFFVANGPSGVRVFDYMPVFLDLKLHDIPNTIGRAVQALLPLRPRMLTLHAAGDVEMIKAAREAVNQAGEKPLLLAVTVLTSLNTTALRRLGIPRSPSLQALRLGRLAIEAGADGLVCSPHEVAILRRDLGDGPVLVVPGIRLPGARQDDQARIMAPREAAKHADWLVVGRPITEHADPGAAAKAIAEEIVGA